MAGHPLLESSFESGIVFQICFESDGAKLPGDFRKLYLSPHQKVGEPAPIALLDRVAFQQLFGHQRLAECAGNPHQEIAHIHRGGGVQIVLDIAQDNKVSSFPEPFLQPPQLGALTRASEA